MYRCYERRQTRVNEFVPPAVQVKLFPQEPRLASPTIGMKWVCDTPVAMANPVGHGSLGPTSTTSVVAVNPAGQVAFRMDDGRRMMDDMATKMKTNFFIY